MSNTQRSMVLRENSTHTKNVSTIHQYTRIPAVEHNASNHATIIFYVLFRPSTCNGSFLQGNCCFDRKIAARIVSLSQRFSAFDVQ